MIQSRSHFEIILKVVVPTPVPLIEPLPAVDFRPCRRICESRFSKKFFSKKIFVDWLVCGVRLKASRNGNYRHGGRTKEMIGGLEAHKINAPTSVTAQIYH